MTKSITPELRAHLERLVARAREAGRNPWDELNAAGLLYTEPRRRMERAAAIQAAMEKLDDLKVPQLLGATYSTGNFTAGDMRRSIMDRLWEFAAEAQEGRL
jgi:hypothetical protein